MTGRIHVLDEFVINRIAAGEVVERPVSVVKELIENSLDARASAIRIDIEKGGIKLIRVKDDGVGMSPDDAFLAVERHATSKLRSEKDLTRVATMGFRGEALASIASVSKMKLSTSDGSPDGGITVFIDGGVLRKPERIGMGRGAIVEVGNLFFNVPVRRKFLKSARVEAGHIHELVARIAVAFPNIAFTFTEDGKLKMEAPPVNTVFERIGALYSRDVRENLMAVDYRMDDGHLHGFIAKPPYARSNIRSVLTFVNGRSVRDRLINSAITRSLSNLLEKGRYPLAILFLDLPAEQVDVNVHPQKAEVRFSKPQEVYDLIVDGIHETLTGAPFRPPPGPLPPVRPEPPTVTAMTHAKDERRPNESAPEPHMIEPTPPARDLPHTAAPSPEPRRFDYPRQGRFGSLGVLGALPNSFLVLYSDEELIVMDHHAAHERILFENLVRAEEEGTTFETQDLLIPKVLEFKPVEARTLAARLDLLNRTGFRIEEFGENDFVIKGTPTWMGTADPEDFFRSLVDVMLDTGVKTDTNAVKEEVLKTMACSAAVKESTALRTEEIRRLLNDLDRIGSVDVCPHGRPFTTSLPFTEIRKKMGRK